MGRSLGCQGGLDRLCHGEDTGAQGSLPTAPDSLESTPCSAAAPLLREALTSGLTPDTRIPLGRAGTRARRGLRATSLGSKWGRPQSQSCAWDRQTEVPTPGWGSLCPKKRCWRWRLNARAGHSPSRLPHYRARPLAVACHPGPAAPASPCLPGRLPQGLCSVEPTWRASP